MTIAWPWERFEESNADAHADLLEPWFDVEVQERESPPRERLSPEDRWEFACEHLGFLREAVRELDPDERDVFRERFLSISADYEDRPLRSTIILGRRHTT